MCVHFRLKSGSKASFLLGECPNYCAQTSCFQWKFQIGGSSSWSILLKNCSRRRNRTFPAWSWRWSPIKTMASRRCKGSSQSRSAAVEDESHGGCHSCCPRHYLNFLEGLLFITMVWDVPKALKQRMPGRFQQSQCPAWQCSWARVILWWFWCDIIRCAPHSPELAPSGFRFLSWKILKGQTFFIRW